jgi:antiviral helicase SKI2
MSFFYEGLLNPTLQEEVLTYLPQSFLNTSPVLGLSIPPEHYANPPAPSTPSPSPAIRAGLRNYIRTGKMPPVLASLNADMHPEILNPPASVPDIMKIGSNTAGLLESFTPDQNTTALLQREYASAFIAGHDSAIQQSLTQSQFRLSSVFDPTSAIDATLFEVEIEEEHEDSSDTSGDEMSGDDGTGRNNKPSSVPVDRDALDEELDAVLGGPDAYWTASDAERRAWRKREQASNTTRLDRDIWAALDSADVSDFASLVPDPAIEYPFDLDVFQRRAIYRLERGENVFVAAHTSAGKTVVAEYAIALAMRNRMRVLVTSPIKSLSNQKFRDFTLRFGADNVGLITGDVSINPEAPILVATTEILRSMLYRGADMIRDLAYVVFDEVHWASDPERGVVWEECLILLPEGCGIVMLSATVPNALEFASWVGKTRKRAVYVVSTYKRPVPLVHSLFVKSEPFPLFDSSKGLFLHANFKAAAEKHSAASKNSTVRFGGGRQHSWVPLIKYLRLRELDPALVFCFSKRKCEESADSLYSTDLTAGAAERNQIHLFYNSAISRLSSADQKVPQISRMRESLKRGIGVHHSGLLPIVNEATEVLFQMGLVRILFCTETLAVGVNLPARTVVFSALKKWDGVGSRAIEPGEYLQMAGRAGRRGKDITGTVLLYPAPADFPSELEVKTLLTGASKHMKSAFRLTYNMLLNLMRVDTLRVEDVMSRSFSEAPAGRDSHQWKKLVASGQAQLQRLEARGPDLDRYRSLHQLSMRLRSLNQSIAPVCAAVKRSTSAAFEVGRVMVVERGDGGFGLAAVVKLSVARNAKLSLRAPAPSMSKSSASGGDDKMCRVALLRGGPATQKSRSPYLQQAQSATFTAAAMTGGKGKGVAQQLYAVGGCGIEMWDVPSASIFLVSELKITVDEQGMSPMRGAPKMDALSSCAEQLRAIADDPGNLSGVPALGAQENGVNDLAIVALWEERSEIMTCMTQMLGQFAEAAMAGEVAQSLHELDREVGLRRKVGELQAAASDESLVLMPDFRQRMEVLRRLGYVEGGSVLLKGRAMCEVNCCELVLVELVFENVVQTLNAKCVAALLSALVFQGGGGVGGGDQDSVAIDRLARVSPALHEAAQATRRILFAIGGVQAECGLPVSPVDYARSQANFGLAEAVYMWAEGSSFSEVCLVVPDVAEGTIVRGIVRLSELLREARNVGRVIGDSVLQEVAEEGIQAVKRDVIFAASLYVQ